MAAAVPYGPSTSTPDAPRLAPLIPSLPLLRRKMPPSFKSKSHCYRKCKVKFRRYLPQIVKVAVTSICVLQISLQAYWYFQHLTIFSTFRERNDYRELPIITVCPWPPFDPIKLRAFGLDISGDMFAVRSNVWSLKILDENLTANDIWRNCGWELDRFVVKVQNNINGKLRYFNEINENRWKRTFTYMGPCFSYFPSLNETNVLIKMNMLPDVPRCQIPNFRCDEIQSECNSTCGFEQFIEYKLHALQSLHVIYHSTHQIEHLDITEDLHTIPSDAVQRFMDGKYDLTTLTLRHGSENLVLKKKYELLKDKCHTQDKETRNVCFWDCLREWTLNISGCVPLLDIHERVDLSNVCKGEDGVNDNIDLIASKYCKNKCLPQCRRYEYEHQVRLNALSSEVNVKLLSTNVTVKRELEMYPSTQFLADVGGILSLFLGVSCYYAILWGWRVMEKNAVKYRQLSKIKMGKYKELTILTVSMTVFGATLIHCMLILQLYITQPVVKSAYISKETIDYNNLMYDRSNDINNAFVRRLASRALGCRSLESAKIECIAQCILKLSLKQTPLVAPYIDLGDLEYCNETRSFLPSKEILLPTGVLDSLDNPKLLDRCSDVCSSFSIKFFNNTKVAKNISIDPKHNTVKTFDVISQVGGAIGLYLGLSLFNVCDYFERNKNTKLTNKCKCFILCKTLIMLLLIAFTCWQLHEYLIGQRTSTIESYFDIDAKFVPTVSICKWPPLNLEKLPQFVHGINISLPGNIDSETKRCLVEDILNALEGNWTVPVDEIWDKSSWNLNEVISFLSLQKVKNGEALLLDCDRGECEGYIKRTGSFMNQCFTLNLKMLDFISRAFFLFSPKVLKKNSKVISSELYASFHSRDSVPNIEDIVKISAIYESTATVTTTSFGSKTGKHTLDYNDCVMECYSGLIVGKYKCRLPYMNQFKEYPLCNVSQYSAVPKMMANLPKFMEESELVMKSEEEPSTDDEISSLVDRCQKACGKFRVVQHGSSVQTEKRYTGSSTLEVTMMPFYEELSRKALLIQKVDSYSFSHLISDSGSIMGFTIGTSVLSLMQAILP